MTRKSKREIERAVEDLTEQTDDPAPLIVYQDPETGAWENPDGTPVDETEADPLVVIERSDTVVMRRERAKREDRDILGPAENAATDGDYVRVAWEEERA